MARNTFDINVKGVPELVAAMKALPAELVSKNGGPVRRALAKSAAMIRDAAKDRVKVRTGNLKDHIAMLRDRRPGTSGASERYMVGIRGGTRTTYANTRRNRAKNLAGKTYEKQGPAFYGRFLELGTSKMAPQPFLRPAFNENADDAIVLFLTALNADIERIAKRLAARQVAGL